MLTQLEIWWLQLRYGTESSADVSRRLGGAVGGAKIRGSEWKDAQPVSGHFGRTATKARLIALRFWVRKHGQPTTLMLSDAGNMSSVDGVLKKHIDENREMLEFIQQKYPSLLEKNNWFEGWMRSQDGFLNDQAKSVPADAELPQFNVIEGKFPRFNRE